MGFDILFRPRGRAPKARAFQRFFEGRANYEWHDRGTDYINDDTGAHFQFFEGDFRADRPPCKLGQPWASFFINYMRPFWFCHQAAPELEAFIREFDLDAELWDVSPDEQGPFSADEFTREWSNSNFETLCYHLDEDETEYQPAGLDAGLNHTYPRDKVVGVWQWNNQRAGMMAEVQEFDIVVPKILYLKRDDAIGTGVVWQDARRTLLPRVDHLILVADQLRRGAGADNEPEVSLLPWSEFEHVLVTKRGGAAVPDSPLNAVDLTDDERTPEIEALFRSAPLLGTNALTTVDPSQVFEREIMDEARRVVAEGDEHSDWKHLKVIVAEDRRN